MKNRKQRPIFRAVVVTFFCVILMGGSNSVLAQTHSKQAEIISDVTDTSFIYLPVIMKNYDPMAAFKNYLPLIIKEETSVEPTDWDILMQDDFEGAFPGVWTIEDKTSTNYEWGKRFCTVSSRTSNVAWAVGGGTLGSGLACGSHYPDNVDTWMMTTDSYSLVGYTQAELVFDRFLNIDFGDEFKWMASIDGTNFYGESTYAFESWEQFVFDLTAVPTLGDITGESEVWIAFVFQSNAIGTLSHGVYLDNIILQACDGSCTPTTTTSAGLETIETSEIFK